MKGNSWLGFIGSAIFHAGLAAALFTAFKEDESANGQSADEIATNISMEMLMATSVESVPPPPEAEPLKQAEPEPEKKETVADPTLKPKPEKPKEKIKEKSKEKPPEKIKEPVKKTSNKAMVKVVPNPQPNAVVAERVQAGNANVNSKATTASANANSNNANLTGGGASSSEMAEYKSRIRREIERHKKYSQRARMMRKQGVVVVAFSIGNDGSISGAHIAESSGTEDLDNSALAAVNAAKAVGPKPNGMSNTLSVPISFKIQ